jgi:hypothetical protein
MILSKIKEISSSKLNVLSISLAVFGHLMDLQELIASFASHLIIILIVIVVSIGLLAMNSFFLNRSDNLVVKDDVLSEENSSYNKGEGSKWNWSIYSKIIFSILIFVGVMTMGSLYYLKNKGVYYVVLQKDLTLDEAIRLKKRYNNSIGFEKNELDTRILEIGKGNYELILNNGYFSPEKAKSDLSKVNGMSLGLKPYTVGPNYGANFIQKIKYFQRDIF